SSVFFLVLGSLLAGCGSDVTQPDDELSSVWVRRFGRASDSEPAGLSAVASGGAIVAGRYYCELGFRRGQLPRADNSYQAYVVRFDAAGNHVYSRGLGAEFAEAASGVSALADGSAVVVGTFDFSVDLGTGPLQTAGGEDIFVARFDPSGKVLWSKRL